MSVTENEHGNGLSIMWKNNKMEYYYFWLRDHCKCDNCYNQITLQKKIDLTDISIEIKAKNYQINGDELNIVWNDEHCSKYSLQHLNELTYSNHSNKLKRNYVLWTKYDITKFDVCHVDYKKILESEEGLYSVMKSLVDYGVGFIENVPPNIKSTEEVILKISHVQNTVFGSMWQFSDDMDHNDTAYTKQHLGPHTDNTYFTEAAGLQVLHCINHNGTGGENLLIDGFKAIEILKENFPDTFTRLTSIEVEAEYLEPGYHYTYSAPLIKLHPITKQPQQIRYNIHDRAPVSIPHDQILEHYKDLRIFGSIIKNPDLEWKFKLNPGTVLIFDNFRILHGRTSYTGHRTMCGCYIGRGDFLSKARINFSAAQ